MKGQFGAEIPGERSMYLRMVQEQLRNLLKALDEREAGVISMRFGLADGQPKTLDEIGKAYGMTRERIRQIERKTLSKLRHPKRSMLLREYLDFDYGPFQEEDHGPADPAARGLVYCEKHGWGEGPSSPGLTCACCICSVKAPEAGRPQEYCSNACKQAAYRRRRARTRKSAMS
jgi:Sigma-70, region 4